MRLKVQYYLEIESIDVLAFEDAVHIPDIVADQGFEQAAAKLSEVLGRKRIFLLLLCQGGAASQLKRAAGRGLLSQAVGVSKDLVCLTLLADYQGKIKGFYILGRHHPCSSPGRDSYSLKKSHQ
jgi:hypothetical protein